MELLGYIVPLAAEAAEHGEESGGSFLVSPGLGLMIWTLVLFLVTMWVLSKVAFPKIQEALDKRAEDDRRVDRRRRTAAQGIGRAAVRVPRPPRRGPGAGRRHHGPRPQIRRDRRSRGAAAGKEKREELVEAAKRDIEAETRRSLDQIRQEVADLTVLATERVTRKSLNAEDQKRLVEEALSEVDFSTLSGSEKN